MVATNIEKLIMNGFRTVAYLKTIVRPAAKFQFALLIVEWEPRNIDLASAFENTRR